MSGSRASAVLVEIAVEGAAGARAAESGGAGRVELASALAVGGTTPSLGAIEETVGATRLEVVVLVRPRPGDFLYSSAEFETMRRDVGHAKAAGARGVALGILRADGSVDEGRTRALADEARPMSVTFHRAFDLTRDPVESLDALLRIGADRVLTSGAAASAFEGQALLAKLVTRAASRIVVMPGAGIEPNNAREIARKTGAREIHLSASVEEESRMAFRNPRVAMGGRTARDEYAARVTSEKRVRAVVAALKSVAGDGAR